MKELIYYVDSAGLNEGNHALSEIGCEECQKTCSDKKSRSLWRLPDRERLDNFLRMAKSEQWPVRIFWAKTRTEKPTQISAEDIDPNEEKLATRRVRSRVKYVHEEAAALTPLRR